MMHRMYITLAIFLGLGFTSVQAKLVQILFTNDLHSYFAHAIHRPEVGGYARLKTLIEQYKNDAEEKHIPSLVVDAGDFLEGNLFYIAKNGRRTMQMMNTIGYDVVTMGNHDYLMGSDALNSLLQDEPPQFAYLGANFWIDRKYAHIKKHVKATHEVVIDGIKIAFLGLTTNEIVFGWRINDGGIENPIKVAQEKIKELKKRGNKIIIGLTHLGLKRDRKLVRKTKDIDLIIGGHSHHTLHRPYYERDQGRRFVPIAQTGEHGEHLGRILLDIDHHGQSRVVEYQLIPVVGVAKDRGIEKILHDAQADLHQQYDNAYLDEVVGHSSLTTNRQDKKNDMAWTYWVTDSMREMIAADVAIHTTGMTGHNYPVGEVTRRDIFEAHPRWFDFNDREGWFIYRAKVPGWLVKPVFEVVMNYKIPLTFSGVDFKWRKNLFGKLKVDNIRIKGKAISFYKWYDMALPEGVLRGGYEISSLIRWLIRKGHRTPYPIVQAIEEKFVRENQTLGLEEFRLQQDKVDRVFYPGEEL